MCYCPNKRCKVDYCLRGFPKDHFAFWHISSIIKTSKFVYFSKI